MAQLLPTIYLAPPPPHPCIIRLLVAIISSQPSTYYSRPSIIMSHRISHRTFAGPDLNYLYATDRDEPIPILGSSKTKTQKRGFKSDKRILRGTTLYLGGEEASNGKIYCIPGHAERVLVIDTAVRVSLCT